jgi:hypothetical protein
VNLSHRHGSDYEIPRRTRPTRAPCVFITVGKPRLVTTRCLKTHTCSRRFTNGSFVKRRPAPAPCPPCSAPTKAGVPSGNLSQAAAAQGMPPHPLLTPRPPPGVFCGRSRQARQHAVGEGRLISVIHAHQLINISTAHGSRVSTPSLPGPSTPWPAVPRLSILPWCRDGRGGGGRLCQLSGACLSVGRGVLVSVERGVFVTWAGRCQRPSAGVDSK